MPDESLPGVDFATFVLSLSHSALVHMGEAPSPETGKVEKELALARQTIDVIAMLEEKTKGNLSSDEGQILESLLFDLRLRYVEALKTPSTGA